MSEMVERVARALFTAEHPFGTWSTGRNQAAWLRRAKMAIAAMREPTPAMTLVGSTTSEAYEDGGVEHDLTVTPIWQSMVDEALR